MLGLPFLSYLLMQSPYQTQVRVRCSRSQCHFRTSINARSGDRLSLLSHVRRDVRVRWAAADLHVHELPLQIWASSGMLEPVRTSLAENKPLAWTRVHDLPDFVFFNHSIHVHKGVGCVLGDGRVDKMPLAWKEEPMTMEWCLECHRHPERHLRDKSDVFRMDLVYSSQEQLQKAPRTREESRN